MATVIAAAIGFRLEWWGYGRALDILRVAVAGGVVSLLLAVVGLIQAWPGRGRRGFIHSLAALLIVLPALLVPLYWYHSKSILPPIQDITTDTVNPPEFWDAPTSRVYPGGQVAAQQRAAFPDIVPLLLPVPEKRVFERALALVKARGWKLVAADPEEGRIEATVTTFWFGFKDDVAIRLTVTDNGTRVDMRSTSRYGGGGDGGANANRIRAFLADLATGFGD
ncbi:MAG TPA: DUF1499 domain-containing protein [Sedimenticola sp.]|nr:DUF1499 domain-containing protein [Sedimenticola sp.]